MPIVPHGKPILAGMNMQPHQNEHNFHAGPRGLAFKNGKLYRFTDRHVVVMRPWPQPMAWYKRRSHNWRPTRKLADEVVAQARFFDVPAERPEKPSSPYALADGQLTLPGVTYEEWAAKRLYKDELARLSFIDLIPSDVRQELARYRDRRWHLLSVFARCPGALDLSRSSPALLFALASNWVFHKPAVSQPIRAVRSLVNRKQCVIQQWLGFPGTESVRRILARIDPAALSVHRLLYLRTALADPLCVRLLRHLPRIGELALFLTSMAQLRLRVTPKLLHETVCQTAVLNQCPRERAYDEGAYLMILDTLRMGNAARWEHCPKRFFSLAGVTRLHDDLVGRMHAVFGGGQNAMPDHLPAPPFAGTDDIVPLTTVEALVQEGYEQHNCAAVRAPLVAQGRQYLYRVNRPVRGTLSVYFNGFEWIPQEFRLASNAAVPQKAWNIAFESLFKSDSNR